MDINYMTVDKKSINSMGAVYREQIVLSGANTSDAIVLPYGIIYAIAINYTTTGTLNIYITNSSEDEIVANTANWVLYDGESEINKAITAIYVDNLTGIATIDITIKVST